jgi:lipopolysaccharide export system protein LptC
MTLPLHLPDLPDLSEGPLEPLGPRPPRPPMPWPQRVREMLSTYLPLLLMLVLALGTWWLVKNTPTAEPEPVAGPPRKEPDYTMQRFVVERFDKDGRLTLRMQGDELRHFTDSDTIEIDRARVRAVSPDGRVTLAQAQRALANGDGTELQLIGDARVDSVANEGETIEFRGEFLHAFLATERLRSHLPVQVRRGSSEFTAAGMDYDHLSGQLQLQGRMRAVLMPKAAAPGKAGSAAAPAPSAKGP